MNLRECPRCGSETAMEKRPNGKIWCPRCNYVVRPGGELFPNNMVSNPKKDLAKEIIDFYYNNKNLMPMEPDEKDLLMKILEEYNAL